ncbi:MAG: hypothetical protein WBA73_07935 [Devosia sp.]
MAYDKGTGLEFIEGFSLFAGVLWLVGALLVGGLVLISTSGSGTVDPAANQTPVAEAPATQ